MTIIEAMDITISNLSNICVPAGMMETVAKPIYDSIGNLKAIRHVLEENRAKKEPEEESKEEEHEEA